MKTGKRIFAWHHWCGLVAGLFLLLMSMSGALLVFTDEMNEAYDAPWAKTGSPGSTWCYDNSFHTIQKKYPGWEIRLYGKPLPGKTLIYSLRKKEEEKKIYADPLSGKLLHAEEGTENQLHRRLLLLHHTLYAGTPGKLAVCCIGILFLVAVVTGFYIYRKAVWKTLTWKKKINYATAKTRYSSLHRIVGVWSLLFNSLIVVTGLFISGKIAWKALQAPAAVITKQTTGTDSLSIDRAIQYLHTEYPSFETHLIIADAKGLTIRFLGRYTNDPFYYGKYYSSFSLDAKMLIVQKQVLSQVPLFERMVSISSPLHFGNYGGWPVKWLYCFFGLMPGLLSITGFLLWQKKKKASTTAVQHT